MVAFSGMGVVDWGSAENGASLPSGRADGTEAEDLHGPSRLVGTWHIELPTASRFSVSPSLCWIFGIDPEEWDGRGETLCDRIHADDRRAVIDLHTRCLTLGVPYSTVFRLALPERDERWVYAEASVLRDPSGAMRAARGTIAELHEDKAEDFASSRQPHAKRLEPQLSREHLALVQQMSDSGSAEIDLVIRGAVWTEGLYRITGRDPAQGSATFDEFIGSIHADDRERARRLILMTARGEEIEPFEFRFVQPDGAVRWLRRHSETQLDATGRPQRMIEVYQDVTERKLLESELAKRDNALRRGKEHLDVAQRIARVGSIDRDLVTRQVTWSDEMFLLLGYQPGEVAVSHENYVARVHPDDIPLVARLQKAAWAGEVPEPVEYRLLLPNGDVRWVLREGAVTLDATGKPAHSVSTLLDITDRKRLELEVRRREDHLNLAQRIARVGSIERDLRTGMVIVSDEVYRLMGLEPGSVEATVDSMAARTHPDDVELIHELHRSSWAGESAPPVEYRVIRPDGGIVWVHREAVITRDESGHPVQSVSTLIDITERKRMEAELVAGAERLRRSEEHLKRAQRVAHVGSIERDLRTGTQFWSDEQYRLFGYRPGEVEASLANGMARVHPDDYARVEESAARITDGEEPGPMEYRLKWPDGTVRWIEREVALTRDERGEPAFVTLTFVDITERKRLEAELIAGAQQLRRIQDHLNRAQRVAHVGSIEVDLRTEAAYWSDEQFRLFGYEPGEVQPSVEAGFTRIHPDDIPVVEESVASIRSGVEPQPLEYRLLWPDGTVRWISRDVAITRDGEGQPAFVTVTFIDITDRKKMETALIESAEKLRRSEEHLNRAQRVAHVGSVEVDLRTGAAYWSDEQYRLFGYEPGEVEPSVANRLARIHPDDHAMVAASVAAVNRGEDTGALEYRLRWPDGTIRWISREVAFTRDENGKPIIATLTSIDVTERKKMETAAIENAEKLRRSQAHLERAQRVGLIGSSELDLRTGQSTWTDQYFRLLGLDLAVKIGPATFRKAIHPDDLAKLQSYDELLAHEGSIPALELRTRGTGAGFRWLLRQVEVMRDAEGKPTYLVFTLQDITERKHLEAALVAYADELRASREHLARAQQAGQVGSVEYFVQTGAMYWSDETYRLLGFDRHVAPTRDLFISAVHPDDRKMFDEAVENARAGIPLEPVTFRVVRPNGEVRWVYRVAEYVRDPRNVAINVVATLTDVTELRRAQQEQARLQEHLAHAQRLESLGALSGGIAHDFNNLLTTILGNAALLREDESLSSDAQHLAQAVIRATQQGAELTRRLLSFGRRQILNPVAIDLPAVARDLDALLRRTLGEEIELEIRPGRDLWRVQADKSQLEAAIINLAVNARDAMPEGGSLTIEIANRVFDDAYVAEHAGAVRGEYVAISVSDTGSGMTPDVLEHAFEPFFTTKQEGRGTGLGLSMVYGFAKQSGGYTSIYSELGTGTCVTIYLPRSTQAAAAEVVPERRAKAAGGTERILLVEDDAMVREYLVTALERLGYRVTAMPDAHTALAHLADDGVEIDLLLTDLMLPGGMNGNHLAAEAAKKRPGLRVLFASGYTQDALIRQGRLEPGQRLIGKPFASGELAAKVREALDS